MEQRTFELFIHLSSTLHFGKTSDACNISPSALSRTIQRLEDEIGTKLFIRDRRSVELTESGKLFREYARRATQDWESFRDSLASGSGHLRGEIALYCSVTASQAVLSGIVSAFRDRHPEVHIRLATGDSAFAIDRILDGSADLTVAARPESLPHSVLFALLATTPLVFIAPKMACEVRDRTTGDRFEWARIPMILADRALSRKRTDEWFRNAGIRPNIYAEVAGHEAILAMVRLGCGVGVVPKLVLDQSALKNEVRTLTIMPELEPYQVGACVHRRRLESPVIHAFWDVVTAAGAVQADAAD